MTQSRDQRALSAAATPTFGVVRQAKFAVRALMTVVVALLGTAWTVAPAWADGPGYGGTANKLALAWSTSPSLQAAGAAASAPSRILVVSGVGFRNLSTVTLRVSANATQSTTVDAAGTLSASVQLPQNGLTLTGTSVVATGMAPSGTQLTLIGSVPPLPSGINPSQVVPWVAALLVLVYLGYRVAMGRARRSRADALIFAHHAHEASEHSKTVAASALGHIPHVPVPELVS